LVFLFFLIALSVIIVVAVDYFKKSTEKKSGNLVDQQENYNKE